MPLSSLGRRFTAWLRGLRPGESAQALPERGQDDLPRGRATAVRAEPVPPRRRTEFAAEAEQVESLRLRVHTDATTGLPNRLHFLGRLRGALGEPGGPGVALLLLRVLRPEVLQARLGADATGRLFGTLAEVLAAYPQHVPGAFAGCLNESDFALCLPAHGVVGETAETLMNALRALPAAGVPGAELVIGGVDGLQGQSVTVALAEADQALAQAEAGGPFSVEVRRAGESGEAPLGERAWRVCLDDALAEGRARLAEYPVLDRTGSLIHLECPLRVQLDAGGPYREARRWLAMASRSRLLPRVDLAAIELALAAVARDGQPRCVHVSAVSLAGNGFIGEVARRLQAQPEGSRRLWLEVADGLSLERVLPRLREAGAAWRRHGVRLGVEHAGGSIPSLARLAGLGLDHVKVEARFVRGVDADPAVREFAAALVRLVKGMGLRAVAEGIDDAADLGALWDIGFDGATGPAVRLPADA
jgi:EAL domain-containing protein (putative c-di-GMP-specific phosphodiesterase class I)/GGDEF domain-containing protein